MRRGLADLEQVKQYPLRVHYDPKGNDYCASSSLFANEIGWDLQLVERSLYGALILDMLFEHEYQYPARIAKEKAEILVRLPKNIRDIAWNAQTRLWTRYRSMVARGKKPTVVVAAIGRERAGFIWAIGQEMRTQMAT